MPPEPASTITSKNVSVSYGSSVGTSFVVLAGFIVGCLFIGSILFKESEYP